MQPRDELGFTQTSLDLPVDAQLEKYALYEERLLMHPDTFSPYVACSSHNIITSKKAPSIHGQMKQAWIFTLCPSHDGEWFLIGQKRSSSQGAKRADHKGQSKNCLSGAPLVMGHLPIAQVTPKLLAGQKCQQSEIHVIGECSNQRHVSQMSILN